MPKQSVSVPLVLVRSGYCEKSSLNFFILVKELIESPTLLNESDGICNWNSNFKEDRFKIFERLLQTIAILFGFMSLLVNLAYKWITTSVYCELMTEVAFMNFFTMLSANSFKWMYAFTYLVSDSLSMFERSS